MNFLPHKICLANEPILLWGTVLSDFAIFCAYSGIAISLMYAYAIRPRGTLWQHSIRSSVLVLFSAFISLCGFSHLFDAVTVFTPLYWTAMVVKLTTAGISLYTLVAITHPHRRNELLRFPEKVEKQVKELDELRLRIATLRPNP